MNDNLFRQEFLGNTLIAYVWVFSILVLGLLLRRLISKLLSVVIYKFVKKFAKDGEKAQFIDLLRPPISLLILLITFYLAFDRLEFPRHWNLMPVERVGFRMFLFRGFQVAIVLSVTWIILRIIDFFSLVMHLRELQKDERSNERVVPLLKEVVKFILVILSFVFILAFIFHLNITSLVVGLGIGGLAIPLAAKESLENLLASFTIFFDKPFVIGDLVNVGQITGHVEKIGFRSTRLRTLEKSYVTVPNKKMVDLELDNLTLRLQRRAHFTLRLDYGTPGEKIISIIEEIKSLINNHPHTDHKEGRVYFDHIGASSFDLQVTYYVNTSHADLFMQVKEEINLKILTIISSSGARLAYPTQSIYLHQQ